MVANRENLKNFKTNN